MSIIDVRHLKKTYASYRKKPGMMGTLTSLFQREKMYVEAVKDISFSIEEGEFVGFIGPNGAGKTTTLKMLSGILWPTSGEASVLGHTPWKRERDFQRQFAIVMGQKNQLWWDLPAKDGFLLNKEIYGIPTREFDRRLKEMGELLNIERLFEVPVNKLSLGERMKCELVNAILHKPAVLFLDEPTIGLDVVSQKAIRDFLKAWNKKEGATVLLTSHSMTDVAELCKRVIVIDKGLLRYDGALDKLAGQTLDHKEVTVTFSEPVKKTTLERFGRIASFTPVLATIHVAREDVREVAKKMLDELPVADLLIEDVAIEEVVRSLFQNA